MRTIKITLYNVEELSPNAKRNAYADFIKTFQYSWWEDNEKSFLTFFKRFEDIGVIVGYSYDEFTHKETFNLTDANRAILNLTGNELKNYLENIFQDVQEQACSLTGYTADEELLAPIWQFLDEPSYDINLEGLLKASANSWGEYCTNDMKESMSYETFLQESNNNTYEYTQDGKLYSKY